METMKKSFDNYWVQVHSRTEWGQYPTEHVIRFIARNYYNKNRKEIRILDFGCGGGAHTWYLAREGFDAYAFDGSNSAVEKLKIRLKKEGLNANVQVCDAAQLKYEYNFFDAIIDNFCSFNNTIDLVEYMYDEMYHILKPGGKILTAVFGKKTLGYGTGKEIEKDTFSNLEEGTLKGRTKIHFFDKQGLVEVLSKNKFVNIKVDSIFYTDNGNDIELLIAKAEKNG